jgi:hypothetical protein
MSNKNLRNPLLAKRGNNAANAGITATANAGITAAKVVGNVTNNAANVGIKTGITAANNAVTAVNAVVNSAANAAAKTVLTKKDKIFIGVLVGIGIIALIGLIGFIMQQANDGKVNAMNQKVTAQEKENKKLAEQQRSAGSIAATNMKRGDQGPPGIQGPPGPTGGVHAAAGPLLCVGQRKVATPTVGVSDASIIYLDDRRYTPIQYWTLRNNPDGTVSVVNKFTGNCMTTNNSKAVFSDKCKNPVPLNQKFNWGPNMQLSSADIQNFCVSVDSKYPMSNENMNRYDLDNMTEKPDSNKGTVSKLLLKKCEEVNDVNQTWWVGN